MQYRDTYLSSRGMSLVEVVIASALVVLVFGALGLTFHLMIGLIGKSKAESGALALANEQLEYIRSLPYDSVGTVSGIPNGPIPQTGTTTLNGITYTKRVLIEYIDSPDDGTGASDINDIVSDYKLVKVQFSWALKGVSDKISLVSYIVPKGIETTAGGGTLTVNVFDANALPVLGASVRVVNTTGTTSIDTTRFTNASGQAMFAGAPAAANYQITVTKDGYSTDKTYVATTTNPNPITLPVAVLAAEVSTMNFQIDVLGGLLVKTFGAPTVGIFFDTFSDALGIATSTGTQVAGDAVTLTGGPGTYGTSGLVTSNTITPGTLAGWDVLSLAKAVPANTNLKVYVYGVTGSSTYTLVPDTYIPGNSAGLTTSVSLRNVPVTYTSLALRGALTSSDAATTSQIQSWGISYNTAFPVLTNIPFTLTGTKTIGTTATASPIYKYRQSTTTNASGIVSVQNLEWDLYKIALGTGSYNIAEVCENAPYVLSPAASSTLSLTLVPSVTRSIRVRVENTSGAAVVGATATLTRSGINVNAVTSACGQTFFNTGLVSATDYQLDVQAPGYDNETVTDINISGAESIVVVLSAT